MRHKEYIQDLDLIFHEATFLKKDYKQAKKTKHSVTADVARMLENTNVKKWILFNFSTRYKDLEPLVNEARMYFPNSEIGVELKTYDLRK